MTSKESKPTTGQVEAKANPGNPGSSAPAGKPQEGDVKRQPPPLPTSQKGGKESGKDGKAPTLSREQFWHHVGFVSDKFSREQKRELALLLAGQLGAVLTFPAAREAVLRKENLSLVQKLEKRDRPAAQNRPQAKPENAAMKGSLEEKTLHEAQEALRKKRMQLGLAKNDTTDNRLLTEVSALNAAKAAFADKKAKIKENQFL